ncbi:MAG: hypothetical protein KAX56_03385 [Phenylobacterium sp.]|nr:hypothetical protein [Phenylobacterium sp.]
MQMGAEQYLATVRRALSSRRTFNKVFGIGGHKTGTTSLQSIFHLCGLEVGDQATGELTSFNARRGHYQPLIEYCQGADAFQDSPFAQGRIYAALDAVFPNSRFILTVRESDAWFRSLESFTAKRHGVPSGAITRALVEQDSYLFPGYVAEGHVHAYLLEPPSYRAGDPGEAVVRWDKLFDRDHYIAVYERRNAEIRDHFKARPEQLLEIDLTKEETIQKITDFLGLPAEFGALPIPHMNQT